MNDRAESKKTPNSPADKGEARSKWTTEDGAICGSTITMQLPAGTEVEFPEEGGIRVVKKPEK